MPWVVSSQKQSPSTGKGQPGSLSTPLGFCLLASLLFAPPETRGQDGTPKGPLLKAGEALIVRVPLDPEAFINGGYAIDSSGNVEFPVLGRIYVHGRECSALAAQLGEKLSAYLKDTHVHIRPAIRITFLGHWQKPGMHYVDPTGSVWDAISRTGGPAGETNAQIMQVWRGNERLKIPLVQFFSSGTSLTGSGIISGDIFVIPVPQDRGWWYWTKESITVAAQVASTIGTFLLLYLTIDNMNE